jgi:(2Fe-2S) ferredoxin
MNQETKTPNLLQNPPSPFLHVFVCINDRTLRAKDVPSCGPSITKETVKEVKYWIMQNNLIHEVLITKTGCLGICPKDGGIIVIYGSQSKTNKGVWYTNIQSKHDIIAAIKQQLQNSNQTA